MSTTMTSQLAGYRYGAPDLPRSPLSDEEFEQLKQTLLWTSEDERYLRLAGEVLDDQVDAILDLWYGFVGSHPHLLVYFSDRNGQPIDKYLAQVRGRFGQWIRDTCRRPYDRDWLNYQQEIALRHHRTKKNVTDGVQSTPIIPLRYLIAFIVPISATIKEFLAKKGHSAEEVERMHQAWFKAVTLTVTLWSYPYVREGDF
ncbi:MAG TPA: protoglobin domain-containing protein [Caldilineaceae bacterium]|nr:protoglobin domain-containing protein [Caldilineaceae bacterium]